MSPGPRALLSSSASRTRPVPAFTWPRFLLAVIGVTLVCGCQGSSVPTVTRGCGGSSQKPPDTSAPVAKREPPRADEADLTWEDLVGESPQSFDPKNPKEPPPSF